MMHYIRLVWHTAPSDDPRVIYYEVDEQRNTTRMLELFGNGSFKASTLESLSEEERERGISSLTAEPVASEQEFKMHQLSDYNVSAGERFSYALVSVEAFNEAMILANWFFHESDVSSPEV